MFRSILKNNTIFGSIQLANILIQLVKGKLVAVILGPGGYGLIAIYNGFLDLGVSATMVGSNTSIVSTMTRVRNESLKSQIRLSQFLFTAFSSTIFILITNIFYLQLSNTVFGSSNYSYLIQLSGIVIVCRQVTLNFQSILQSQRDMKGLYKSNLYGLIFASAASVLVYFFFGIEALFLAVLITHFIVCIFYVIFGLKYDFNIPSFRRLMIITNSNIKPGLYLFIGALLQLVIFIFIRKQIALNSSVAEVGLLNAGLLIMNSYVGLVLSSLSSDYLPRLSSEIRDEVRLFKVLSGQYEIILRIIVPILIGLMIFAPIFLPSLFTEEFIGLVRFIKIFVFASLFKSLSWVISYVFLAKSMMRAFLGAEVIFNSVVAILLFGNIIPISIESVAVSFALAYFIYFIVLLKYLKSMFRSFNLRKLVNKVIVPLILMALVYRFAESWIFSVGIFVLVIVHSGYKLFQGYVEK